MHQLIVIATLAVAAGCGVEPDAASCTTEPGPEMRPGWNCLSCHRENGKAASKVWSAAGTVYDTADASACDGTPGVDVVFFAPSGAEVERVRTNAAGNFFTTRVFPDGFRVGVERDGKLAMMPIPPPAGSCNACHSDRPIGEALGRIRAP